ncbi:MAG: hypothetical protein RR219_07500 [Clostridiales bacterium]
MNEKEILCCNYCGEKITHPIIIKEGDVGGETLLCPLCHSQDLCLLQWCTNCKKYRPKEDNVDFLICDDCGLILKNRFKQLMKENFNDEQRAKLNEIYEGECF